MQFFLFYLADWDHDFVSQSLEAMILLVKVDVLKDWALVVHM
jgi:hypothetical protein